MERVGAAYEAKDTGHFDASARDTQQLDYFDYDRDISRREPKGRRRAAAVGGRHHAPDAPTRGVPARGWLSAVPPRDAPESAFQAECSALLAVTPRATKDALKVWRRVAKTA